MSPSTIAGCPADAADDDRSMMGASAVVPTLVLVVSNDELSK